jgi:hypothetical protein
MESAVIGKRKLGFLDEDLTKPCAGEAPVGSASLAIRARKKFGALPYFGVLLRHALRPALPANTAKWLFSERKPHRRLERRAE